MATSDAPLEWWQTSIIYQIYPRSFQDSTGDGVGDILGIIDRLDYFTDIGVGALWLSPFYPSPQCDFGYDISDFCDVSPLFGMLEDFDELVEGCHRRGIRLMVDFVPGHSSDQHEWFQKSVKKEAPYTDYYVWHDGVTGSDGARQPPNNWLSVFGGSSWAWCKERGQYYFRPFLKEQPKLNFRNPLVVEEMKNVLRFWLDRGVDGIRVDALADIMEAEDKSLDEPRAEGEKYTPCQPDQHEYLDHIHTQMHPEGFPLVRGWKDVIEEYEKEDGRSRFMVIEIYGPPSTRNVYRQYGGTPFNMDLVEVLEAQGLSGHTVRDIVSAEYDNLPEDGWPTFVLGNHDRHRFSSKFGPKYSDALNMVLLTLWGTPTTYYGEEIGMRDIEVSYEATQDPFGKNMGPDRYLQWSRDPCRAPMQWDESKNAGFTTHDSPWLPVHPEFETWNVSVQNSSNRCLTPLQVYKNLASLRQDPAFRSRYFEFAMVTNEIFSYIRGNDDTGRYLVAVNIGKKAGNFDLSKFTNTNRGTVCLTTCSAEKEFVIRQDADMTDVVLFPGYGIVVSI